MKKASVISLIISGSALVCVTAAWLCAIFCIGIPGAGLFLSILPLGAHIAGAAPLQKLFKALRWLSPLKLWICSGVPTFSAGAVIKLVDVVKSGTWYFKSDILSIICLALTVYSAVFLTGFGIWLLGSTQIPRND